MKKQNYVPYDFAINCPDPCLADLKSKNIEELNRPLKPEEKTIHFLTSNFHILNKPAYDLLVEKFISFSIRRDFVEINRVNINSPHFGRKKYRIRFLGFHGLQVKSYFLITYEDNTNPRVVQALNTTCAYCGATGVLFKVYDHSKSVRCGACLALPGTNKIAF